MLNIRPVSDLSNKYPEIEETVLQRGAPAFLTKNGYGSLALLSPEQYSILSDGIEAALDEADRAASMSDLRFSGEEVFARLRKNIHGREAI